MISSNEEIYVLLSDQFDLSSKMGITIHGIIGYNLLKNVIAKINYKSKKIIFYNPKLYKYRKCRKCEVFPLYFRHKKPYINVKVQLDTVGTKKTAVTMLIDSGGSDAIWLFEGTKEEIKTPKRFFKDILGEGLSGTVFGNRSRIPELSIGKFKIKKPTVSFLDSISTYNARKFKQRNGSIGGNILKRFKVWIDYPNKKIVFKKNGCFKGGFNYNMSGINLVYNGKVLVKERYKKIVEDSYGSNLSGKGVNISFITNYKYSFKSSYKIYNVIPGSSAEKIGLLKEDIIVKINGKSAHNFTMSKITSLFQERDKKKIRLVIERKGVRMKFEFRLEKRI